MIDNKIKSRFELSEQGYLAWADYQVLEGRYLIVHVEAEPPLRGSGTAGRLMRQIVEYARANRILIVPRCSYARVWFDRNPQAKDVLF